VSEPALFELLLHPARTMLATAVAIMILRAIKTILFPRPLLRN